MAQLSAAPAHHRQHPVRRSLLPVNFCDIERRYPFAAGAKAQDSVKRIAAYYNPSVASYFELLHLLSKAMWCFLPVVFLHELYLFFNDNSVDDFDNKATILLCVALTVWATLLSSMLQRPTRSAPSPPNARPFRAPITSLRAAAALCITLAFVYLAYNVNEAKLVYLLYRRDDMKRDGDDGASGLGPRCIYKFLVEVLQWPTLIACPSVLVHRICAHYFSGLIICPLLVGSSQIAGIEFFWRVGCRFAAAAADAVQRRRICVTPHFVFLPSTHIRFQRIRFTPVSCGLCISF
jgi:hypothetical protein